MHPNILLATIPIFLISFKLLACKTEINKWLSEFHSDFYIFKSLYSYPFVPHRIQPKNQLSFTEYIHYIFQRWLWLWNQSEIHFWMQKEVYQAEDFNYINNNNNDFSHNMNSDDSYNINNNNDYIWYLFY